MGSYVAAPEALFAEIGCLEAAGEYRLTEVARKFLDKGARTVSYRIYDTDEVQGINTPEELDGAADIVLKRLFTPKKDTDTTIKFGTGGWRAVIGEGYTLANLRRLSQAIANEATRQGTYSKGIVIGGDRRFLSRESAEAAAEVFAGNNIPVRLLPEDVPTPLVTFAAPYLDAAYGVIITSSHNPTNWNGLKVFRADGSLPLDEETDRFQDEANALGVEDVITLDLDLARQAGIVNEEPLTDEYVDAIEEIVDVAKVRGSDRIGIVDENGDYVSSNELLLLLYWYLHEMRGEEGGVVRNIATTHMLDRLADHFGEPLVESKVGFKHSTAGMEEIDAVLGGESSGGLTVRGWLLGKDGIFACALVAEMLATTGKPISQLLDEIYEITGRLYQVEDSVPATPEMRVEIPRRMEEAPLTHIGPYKVASTSDLDGLKIVLEDGDWALLRFSGTEPLLRMVAEASSPEKAEELLEWLREFVTA